MAYETLKHSSNFGSLIVHLIIQEDKGNQGNNLGWKNIVERNLVAKLVVT